MPGVTGELMLKGLAPQWLAGDGYTAEKPLIMVTKGVRVMVRVVVSTDWWVLG